MGRGRRAVAVTKSALPLAVRAPQRARSLRLAQLAKVDREIKRRTEQRGALAQETARAQAEALAADAVYQKASAKVQREVRRLEATLKPLSDRRDRLVSASGRAAYIAEDNETAIQALEVERQVALREIGALEEAVRRADNVYLTKDGRVALSSVLRSLSEADAAHARTDLVLHSRRGAQLIWHSQTRRARQRLGAAYTAAADRGQHTIGATAGRWVLAPEQRLPLAYKGSQVAAQLQADDVLCDVTPDGRPRLEHDRTRCPAADPRSAAKT